MALINRDILSRHELLLLLSMQYKNLDQITIHININSQSPRVFFSFLHPFFLFYFIWSLKTYFTFAWALQVLFFHSVFSYYIRFFSSHLIIIILSCKIDPQLIIIMLKSAM